MPKKGSEEFNRSQRYHSELMNRHQRHGNTPKNRAFANYHADCIENQNRLGRTLRHKEKQLLFSWWQKTEVEDIKVKYPELK